MYLDSAVYLASVFGPFLVILGLWMILYSKNLVKIWASFKTTPSAFFLMGAINLLLGLFIISHYNFWSWSKSFLVTLLGWVLIIRGVMAFFVPQVLIKATMSDPASAKMVGWIPFIWGMILCWVAFV